MDFSGVVRVVLAGQDIFGVWHGPHFIWPDPWTDFWDEGLTQGWANVWHDSWTITPEGVFA